MTPDLLHCQYRKNRHFIIVLDEFVFSKLLHEKAFQEYRCPTDTLSVKFNPFKRMLTAFNTEANSHFLLTSAVEVKSEYQTLQSVCWCEGKWWEVYICCLLVQEKDNCFGNLQMYRAATQYDLFVKTLFSVFANLLIYVMYLLTIYWGKKGRIWDYNTGNYCAYRKYSLLWKFSYFTVIQKFNYNGFFQEIERNILFYDKKKTYLQTDLNYIQ